MNPSVACAIKQLSYSAIGRYICFSVQYEPTANDVPVFLARDEGDIKTAISVAFKLHLKDIVMVVDNRAGFVKGTNRIEEIERYEAMVGEELHYNQRGRMNYRCRGIFGDEMLIFNIRCSYFDTAKEVNDLTCRIGEQAIQIRRACGNDINLILNSVRKWFRDNIRYLDTGETSDHSAVGLFKNKTAVCQGIAVYAYQLLSLCGVDARYVSGEGLGTDGWGPHGWNLVRVDDEWKHIDFTFEMNSSDSNLIKDEAEFRKNHRWEEFKYSQEISDNILRDKRALAHSAIKLIPEKNCYSINDCIVDVSNSRKMCVVRNGEVLINVFDVICAFGGAFVLKNDSVYIYIGTNRYVIAFWRFELKDGAWYASAKLLRALRFEMNVDGGIIVIRNNN